ncbi:unnamed protein product [Rhizophagus irregularis]|nr:unnamed protein product [Rhizophagus irregularis]
MFIKLIFLGIDLLLLYACLKNKHNYYNVLNIFRSICLFNVLKGILNGYCYLFITLFDIIKQLTGKPIQVKHIHVIRLISWRERFD